VSRLARIARWVWEFVVGDDWVVALGVIVALGVTATVAAAGVAAWWIMALAVPLLLALSLRRAAG
jgi:hypothetical protein